MVVVVFVVVVVVVVEVIDVVVAVMHDGGWAGLVWSGLGRAGPGYAGQPSRLAGACVKLAGAGPCTSVFFWATEPVRT